jgi:hypothetical protein
MARARRARSATPSSSDDSMATRGNLTHRASEVRGCAM